MDKKQKIINLFNTNVRGKNPDLSEFNVRHDGKEGHWLERQMGIDPNAKNEADLLGYEMKKDTTSKTTFGDWSPDLAVWKSNNLNENLLKIDRDTEFLKYFGKPNALKKHRLSWSGEPVPTIKDFNKFGQILRVDSKSNILAYYSFSKDKRTDKESLIPKKFQIENLVLAKWLKASIKVKLERKFNDKGWFKCYKNSEGIYTKIGFGGPISYHSWINHVQTGIVYFDSGMYAGNPRPYAQWRANNNYWESLVIEEY